jgi:hypothetical protein
MCWLYPSFVTPTKVGVHGFVILAGTDAINSVGSSHAMK